MLALATSRSLHRHTAAAAPGACNLESLPKTSTASATLSRQVSGRQPRRLSSLAGTCERADGGAVLPGTSQAGVALDSGRSARGSRRGDRDRGEDGEQGKARRVHAATVPGRRSGDQGTLRRIGGGQPTVPRRLAARRNARAEMIRRVPPAWLTRNTRRPRCPADPKPRDLELLLLQTTRRSPKPTRLARWTTESRASAVAPAAPATGFVTRQQRRAASWYPCQAAAARRRRCYSARCCLPVIPAALHHDRATTAAIAPSRPARPAA
jgi:hypothetical protein